MTRNVKEVQKGATAPDSLGRDSGGLLYWACSSESKKDERGGWKVEACRRGEEEKMNRVSPTTLGWDTSGGH